MNTGKELFLEISKNMLDKGMSRKEAAEKIGITIACFNVAINRIKNHEQTTLRTLIKMADIMDKKLKITFENKE